MSTGFPKGEWMDKFETLTKRTPASLLNEVNVDEQTKAVDFTELYHETANSIFRYLYSRVRNAQDAEDLTSQTFLAAYENLSKLHDPDKFTSWVFTIARNKAYDFFRKSRRHPTVEFDEELDQASDDARKLSRKDKDRLIDLEHLIIHLAPREQEYLRLRIVAELPFAEIASILKKPETRIKKRYYRLLDRLQAQMEQ
jgi:RNA polymerase sigma-70 factor (ECF subfamily)